MLPTPPPLPVPDMVSIGTYDAIVWTAFTLALITTALRLYTRAFVVRAWCIDDTLMLLGTLFAASFLALTRWHVGFVWDIRSLSLPAGRLLFRDTPLSIKLYNLMFRSAFVSDLIYICTLPFIKCSVLFFYRRIAHLRRHLYLIYALAFLIVAQAIILISVTLASIKPLSAVWDPMYTPEQTMKFPQTHIQISHSSLQLFFDLVLLALPVPVILKTKLPKKKRVGLIFIYCLSFFSVAATAFRLASVVRFNENVMRLDLVSERMNYSYWAVLEVMTAIMCANLPALPALYRHIAGKGNVTTTAGSGYNGSRPSTFNRSFFRQWFDIKATSMRQSSARHGAARSNFEAGSVSQTNLTSGKGFSGVESKEMEVMSPTNGSYSTYVTSTENEKNAVSVAVSSPIRGSRYYSRGTADLKPSADSESSSVGSERQGGGMPPNTLQDDGRIYRTDEVNVESSIV